ADLSFKTKTFTIKRGKQVALKAWFERKQVDGAGVDTKPPAPPGQPLADREMPFVLIRARTGEKIECGTLARAFEILLDGDVIEVHGNGPFTTGGVRAKDKSVTLRAAPGYRPQIRGDTNSPVLRVENGRLLVDGCDLRAPNLRLTTLIVG